MGDAISTFLDGLQNAGLMAYEVWWALVLGFAISAVVQAWVPRARIERALSGGGFAAVSRATGLGAASSSCSYAAIAIAKSLFQKGASAATVLAFQFASTNLVWELGLVLWLLIGWQFTLAEFVGGLVLVALMAVLLRVFVSPRLEERARDHAQRAAAEHQHHAAASEDTGWRERLTSVESWSDVAHNFRGDWFVCSIGNVPLAAVLWSGGISFGGVMAFIFADLIVLPIVAAYRKYYGLEFALRITALMFVTMVVAALCVDGLFSLAGIIPSSRPTRADVFGSIEVDYKLVLNVFATAIFGALMYLTVRRGTRDPVCGMTVDRARAVTATIDGRTHYFCSEACRDRFLSERTPAGASTLGATAHG